MSPKGFEQQSGKLLNGDLEVPNEGLALYYGKRGLEDRDITKSFYFCLWCMCVYIVLYTCVHRGHNQCVPLSLGTLFFETGCLTNWKLTIQLDELAGGSRISPVSASPVLGLQACTTIPEALHGCSGFGLRSSSLCSKCFIGRAMVSASKVFILTAYVH